MSGEREGQRQKKREEEGEREISRTKRNPAQSYSSED